VRVIFTHLRDAVRHSPTTSAAVNLRVGHPACAERCAKRAIGHGGDMKGMSSFEKLNDLGFSPLAMVGIWRGEALVLTMKAIVLWPVWLVKWVMAKASPASHNKRSTPRRSKQARRAVR